MSFRNFLKPQFPILRDWSDHPDLQRMSHRDLADLPTPRPTGCDRQAGPGGLPR